jgi:hypothetical protein
MSNTKFWTIFVPDLLYERQDTKKYPSRVMAEDAASEMSHTYNHKFRIYVMESVAVIRDGGYVSSDPSD